MTTPPRIAELAVAARDYVQRAVDMDLDGSVESLAFLDHYLGQVGDVDEDVLELLAAATGAYFGELVISHLGGDWQAQSDDPSQWTVTLEGVPLSFRPVAMAAEAIRQDDVEDMDANLITLSTLEQPLAEAMNAVSPVEASYYYSLTGRLETIEHAAEIIAELRHQLEDDAKPAGRPPTSN